ncbi:hypothetical protein AB0I81_55005 [Nonomuraea sp. NPDC050404]|uniref:hypothetical protein n=1 Tax=Nonomuraea sp. NPDC050404 TaxID=3155783 RepID=UPI0033C7AD1C
MEVVGGALRSQANRLVTNGEEYAAAVQRLQARGGRWGDDGLFAAIESTWIECRQTMIEAVPGIGSTINGVGMGVNTVSNNIDAANAASTI